MYVGVLRMEFSLHGNDSLKGKRRVANSLKQKLRNKFNLSIAEVESMDSHTRLVLGASSISNDYVHLEKRLNNALRMAEAISPEEMTYSDIEIFGAD